MTPLTLLAIFTLCGETRPDLAPYAQEFADAFPESYLPTEEDAQALYETCLAAPRIHNARKANNTQAQWATFQRELALDRHCAAVFSQEGPKKLARPEFSPPEFCEGTQALRDWNAGRRFYLPRQR